MKKKFALICVLAMVLSSMTGCTNTMEVSEESTPVASEQSEPIVSSEADSVVQEPVQELPISDGSLTLTVAMPVHAKVEDINTNTLTQYIEEHTGINLEIIELSQKDAASQVNSMMTGGELPDVFIGYAFPYDALCSYADAGLLQPLDDYIDKWGYNLKNTIMQDEVLGGENVLRYATYDDQIWAMPAGGGLVTNIYEFYLPRLQTRFLEELNMDMPTTLDGLRAYLEAVKAAHPDVIPMTSFTNNNYLFPNISQAFQYTDPLTYLKVTEDGTVEFIGNNDLFKEAIEYTKAMVDDGLIDPATWTQDLNTVSTYMAQDGYNAAVLACGAKYANVLDSAGDEYDGFVTLAALEGPHGYKAIQDRVVSASVKTAMVITSACEHPEEAFRLFDFCLSDEFAIQARVGTEGEQWAKAADGVLGRDGEQAWFSLLTPQEWVQPQTNVVYVIENFIHSNIMNHCEGSGEDDENMKYGWTLTEMAELSSGESIPNFVMPAEDAAEYEETKNLIVAKVNSDVASFVLGDKDLAEWDDYCEELKSMGVDRYVELAQKAYDAMSE